jgi:hypothetical protein
MSDAEQVEQAQRAGAKQDTPGARFKRALDAGGFPFQYAVLRYCEELFAAKKTLWTVEASEFPVDVGSANTHIDFILHAYHRDSGRHAFLVCECKRVNPAFADWGFVRSKPLSLRKNQGLAIFEAVWIEQATGKLLTGPIALAQRTEPFDVATEIKGAARGDPSDVGRRAIENAATQVCRGVSGLINFFKDHPHVIGGAPPAVVVPVIFSTAHVYSSDSDVADTDINTGELIDDVNAHAAEWLWYQYNLSSPLRHSAPKDIPTAKLTRLGSLLTFQSSRSIAIVSPSGIERFLQEMPNNLEDLQALRADASDSSVTRV